VNPIITSRAPLQQSGVIKHADFEFERVLRRGFEYLHRGKTVDDVGAGFAGSDLGGQFGGEFFGASLPRGLRLSRSHFWFGALLPITLARLLRISDAPLPLPLPLLLKISSAPIPLNLAHLLRI
jgi:hypothetical protein